MLKHIFDLTKLKHVLPILNTAQPSRSTYVLKRKYPVVLHKKGQVPRKLRSRDYVYEIVEVTDMVKQPKLDLILTTYVEETQPEKNASVTDSVVISIKGIVSGEGVKRSIIVRLGEKGDRVSVRPKMGYENLLLPGFAVYPTPNNIKRYCDPTTEKVEKVYSSPYVQRTLNFLSNLHLSVFLNKENPWTIEPWHVRSAFRRIGIIVPEDAITLPEVAITGPDLEMENKVFYVTVTVNNKETVQVRCRIHHWGTNPEDRLPPVPEFWKIEEPALVQ